MKLWTIYLALFILTCFTTCNKGPLCSAPGGNRGIIESSYSIGNSFCVDFNERNFVARNDSEFRQIYTISKQWDDCRNFEMPEVDFSKYSLLGQQAGTCKGGNFLRTVTKNEAEKKIIYTVQAKCCGYNKVLLMSKNIVLVPKIPQDYTVEFILEED